MIVSDEREKDIQLLCNKVINVAPIYHYNTNGPDESVCPFCYVENNIDETDLKKFRHKQDCLYLVAKDLSTNINK